MNYSPLFLTVSALLLSASGHTIMQQLYVNGVAQGHTTGIRVPSSNGPIMDVTSDDVICNGGINPYQEPVSQVVINVTAGASMTAEWHNTLAGADPSDFGDPILPSHKGPVIVYLAMIPSATQTSVTGLKWFKIWEDGLTSDGKWGVDRLIENKGKHTFTIPSCISSGQYLVRTEIIALQTASGYPGAQLYMECGQLNIVGGLGSKSPATVSFVSLESVWIGSNIVASGSLKDIKPGAYKGSDPGITFPLYWPWPFPMSYTIPGPPVFSC